MSVILDALKRVQAEGQRREHERSERESRPQGHDDALLRRLAEPRAERPDDRPPAGGDGVSPVVWAVLTVVIVVGAVALGLRWMAPSFDTPNANEDRPLLADLTGPVGRGEGRSGHASGETGGAAGTGGREAGDGAGTAASEPPHAGGTSPVVQVPPEEDDLPSAAGGQSSGAGTTQARTGQGGGAGVSSPGGTGPAQIWAPPHGDDLSDLPANVGASTGSAPTSGIDSEEGSEGYLRLEVADEGVGRDGRTSSGSEVQIDSSGDLSGQETGSTRSATVPSRLVDPGVRDAFEEGVRLQRSGQLQRAEQAYNRALKLDPHNARVNLNLGVLYEQQDELPLAERHLRQAVSAEPDNANGHNNLGVVLYRMGNYDAALIQFNRALALDPDLLDAHTNKGLILTRWGRYDDAERVFLQVLVLEPDHALAHYNLGLVYEETDQFDKAVQRYQTFLRLGAADYPEITDYLSGHLDWLEGRVGTSGAASNERR